MSEKRLDLTLSLDGLPETALSVLGFHVQEQLSDGYRLLVDCASAEVFDFSAMLGAPASLTLLLDGEGVRWFHGVLFASSLAAHWGDGTNRVYVARLEVAAHVEALKLGRDCRIFQQKTVPEIVDEVVAGAGAGIAVEWRTRTTYPVREHVIQYNESDFDFVSRLLAEEGIGFVVRNDASTDTVVFFDDDGAWEPLADGLPLRDRDCATVASHGHDAAFDLRDGHVAAPDAVMLRDYDPKRPALDLSCRAEAPDSTAREVYVHPGGFLETTDGERMAERLLQRLRLGTRRLEGKSHQLHLEPGRRFTLQGHRRAELDTDWVVLSVVHGLHRSGPDGEGQYVNELRAFPSEAPYRPTAVASRPVPGPMLAFDTVPSSGGGGLGEGIHNDEHGRAKVRFPWDRSGITDDRAFGWLRVGQLPLSGPMIMPRKDFELLVDHERGHLDRPFVAGHLYNREAMPPYPLPEGKTRFALQTATTDGGSGANELRFEDSAGAEEIFFNASRDASSLVDDDADWSVKVDDSTEIGADSSLRVSGNYNAKVGGARSLDVGGQQKIAVQGSYADTIGGSFSTTVGGSRNVKAGGDLVENTTSTLTRTVDALQVVTALAGYQRKVASSAKTNVSAAWLELAAGSRMLSVATVFSETVGAVKLISSKTFSVSCIGAYALTGAAHTVKAGGGRTDTAKGLLAVSAGGGLKVKAANINFEASSKLVVRAGACTITLSGGQCEIKAPNVDLTGVKALGQAMHKSN